MTTAIMQSTQVAISLSVNVIVKDDTGIRLLAFPILFLTGLFLFLWQVLQHFQSLKIELAVLVSDLSETLSFTSKVLAIVFNSLVYGLT